MLKQNHRRAFTGTALILLLAAFIAGAGLEKGTEGKAAFTDQEMKTMAETWAEALKTRDGEPRYEMMSEKMKEKFIAEQKQRGAEPWNFNIGVSSPWVTDYQVTVKKDSAEILYHMTDSTQQIYDNREIIYFGKENGRTVVIKSTDLISDWERYDYFAPTAEEAMKAYRDALLSSDYLTILSLTHNAKLEPNGQEIWDTIRISDVKITGEDVRDSRACYQLELTIENAGDSAFEKGVSPRWLWLVRGEQGWYAEGLMTGGEPDSDWWDSGLPEQIRIGKEAFLSGNMEFDKLIYLSLLSSSTFDYAENKMKGTRYKITDDLFSIDYPDQDDYVLKDPVYTRERMNGQMVRSFEDSTMNQVSLIKYKERYQYSIHTKDLRKTHFRLYVFDGQVWLSSYADNTADKSEIIMDLRKLK